MISFKTFITESVEAATAFESAKTVAPYIKSERYREAFLEAADELSKAAKAKEIYNARFGEYKMRVMKGIEYAYSTLFDKIKDDVIKSGQETYDLWSVTSVADINKISKIYDKMPTKIKEASDFVDAVRGIPNAIKVMKSYVKSGKPPSAPQPGQFIKPLASMAASKLALEFMKEATDTFKKDLEENITKQVTDAYNKLKKANVPSDISKDPTSANVASLIFIVRTQSGKKVLELKSNADELVQRLIKNNVNDIVDGFVGKNSAKLALILQKKDAPKSHEIVNTNIKNGMVENTMKFEFNDGSSFTLESSVVYKYSKTGKLFFQYPTRFKNVKLADGTQMRMPSEEKMIKEF